MILRAKQATVVVSIVAIWFLAACVFGAPGGNGKPGGGDGEVTPQGTIYYRTVGDATYAMDGDGNNKRFVPGIDGYWVSRSVSSGVYGADPQLDRLWLQGRSDERTYNVYYGGEIVGVTNQSDIYVVFSSASGEDYVKLTDFFGSILVHITDTSFGWSSDGQDSFISFMGRDLSGAFFQDPDTGQASINWDNTEVKPFRIHISGLEIDAGILAGDWTPMVDDRVSPDPYVEEIDYLLNGQTPWIQWCPDGRRFLHTTDGSSETYIIDLDDVDPATGRTPLWVAPNDGTTFYWSPLPFSDGEYRILFYNRNSGDPGIYTIKPDGTELTPVVLNGKRSYKVNPIWSPDNRYIVFRDVQISSGFAADSTTIVRIPVPGTGTTGKAVTLTNDLDSKQLQLPVAWVP